MHLFTRLLCLLLFFNFFLDNLNSKDDIVNLEAFLVFDFGLNFFFKGSDKGAKFGLAILDVVILTNSCDVCMLSGDGNVSDSEMGRSTSSDDDGFIFDCCNDRGIGLLFLRHVNKH